MATTVITGRDISLSFTGGTDIEAQATNAVLTKEFDRQTYQTLDGEAYKVVNVSGTFQLDMLADWGKTSSVCEALWTACDSSPNSEISITLTSCNWRTICVSSIASLPNRRWLRRRCSNSIFHLPSCTR
jgi:hypothetical protein